MVNAVMNTHRSSEHTLSDQQYKFICKVVYDTTGIVLDGRKKEMVYRRLMRRTRDLQLPSFDAYCQLLKNETSAELPHFTNAITTNLTSFFREQHHFDYLTNTFIPQHIDEHGHTQRLRIWSAACSTGEEPYSLAITLRQAIPEQLKSWDAKILATDLDTEVLATAQAGIYKTDRIEALPKNIVSSFFKRGTGNHQEFVRVAPELVKLITFKNLNLLHRWPVNGPFDVIMCRNVLIYFDKETQYKLIQRYHQLLRPGGLLILGHSESLSKVQTQFHLKGRTIFEKITDPMVKPNVVINT